MSQVGELNVRKKTGKQYVYRSKISSAYLALEINIQKKMKIMIKLCKINTILQMPKKKILDFKKKQKSYLTF